MRLAATVLKSVAQIISCVVARRTAAPTLRAVTLRLGLASAVRAVMEAVSIPKGNIQRGGFNISIVVL